MRPIRRTRMPYCAIAGLMMVCLLASWSFALIDSAVASDGISPVPHTKRLPKIEPKNSRVVGNDQLDFQVASTCVTSCTVSFNPNQVDTPPPVDQSVPIGGFAVWPDDPVRPGYFLMDSSTEAQPTISVTL